MMRNFIFPTNLISKNDRIALAALLILSIISRILAFPASLWEWDDVLFAKAIHHYSIPEHSPHPPGFPVFVAFSRIAYWFLNDDHLALSAVSIVFSILFIPAVYVFFRIIFEDVKSAFVGALLCAFAPNIWFFSASPRSDQAALTFGMIALTLITYGLKSQRSLIIGCAMMGIGVGIRVTVFPLTAPMILFVFITYLRKHQWKPILWGLLAGSIGVLIWFVPMVVHTTWEGYFTALRGGSDYVVSNDTSFTDLKNGNFYKLYKRFGAFFIKIWGKKGIGDFFYIAFALGITILFRNRNWRVLTLMSIAFIPHILFCVIFNQTESTPLYAMVYLPLFVGISAYCFMNLSELFKNRTKSNIPKYTGIGLACILLFYEISWALPAVKTVHKQVSPPIQAMEYLKNVIKFDPSIDLLHMSGHFIPHVSYYFPKAKWVLTDDPTYTPLNLIDPSSTSIRWISLTEIPTVSNDDVKFDWGGDLAGFRRLSAFSRGRYINTFVSEISAPGQIMPLSGWYNHMNYSDGYILSRWTDKIAETSLFNAADSMILKIRGKSPIPNSITLRIDGKEIDKFKVDTSEFEKQLTVHPSVDNLWSILTIETESTVKAGSILHSNDAHNFGTNVASIQWLPAQSSHPQKINTSQIFIKGWFDTEGNSPNVVKWAEPESVISLPAFFSNGLLDITMVVPEQSNGNRPNITIRTSSGILDSFAHPAGSFTKRYKIPSSIQQNGRIEIIIDNDRRESKISSDRIRAIQVSNICWRPVE